MTPEDWRRRRVFSTHLDNLSRREFPKDTKSLLLTVFSLCLRSTQPLRQAAPPNLRSLVTAVSTLIAAPWLKPPTTIRPGSIPDSISAEMS